MKETLDYTLDFWARAEDVIYQKNLTNQLAIADIEVDGVLIASHVPVDELLGLEKRLEVLRGMVDVMPTLPASVKCLPADTQTGKEGSWVAESREITSKTEKIMVPVVLYEATKEHPAQVKEVPKDVVVGTYEKLNFYGAATTMQKSDVIANIDKLLAAVKQARMRANSIEASKEKIGEELVKFIMSPFKV